MEDTHTLTHTQRSKQMVHREGNLSRWPTKVDLDLLVVTITI